MINDWVDGTRYLPARLTEWKSAYSGKGHGQVDDRHYPDPWVGDLRGETYSPKLITLGLNPGVGFDGLQSETGVWARRCREAGYSRCFDRSPEEDESNWRLHRGKRSRFWVNLINFTRRWLQDADAGVRDILNMELYPWHSNSKTGPIVPSKSIVEEFIVAPLSEIDVSHVFAFGSDWFRVAAGLGLPEARKFGSDELMMNAGDRTGWKLSAYSLSPKQVLVVNSQAGYAGPPGAVRTERMRDLLGSL